MSKGKKPPVNRAVATIKKKTNTDARRVAVTHEIAQAMPQGPNWGAATDVQSSVKTWSAGADALDANAKLITSLKAQLKTAEAKQLELRRDWTAAKKQVLSNVTVFCGGSADMVKTFTLDVITRSPIGELPAPINLTVNPGKAPGEVLAAWDKGLATHGFVVQHATDPSNAATVSATTPSTKPKFTLGGMPQGANVSFRVAAIDPASPTGQSPWTSWIVGNAR